MVRARGKHLLTAAEVKAAKPPAMLHDGAGLYCQITDAQRSWLFRFSSPTTNKRRWLGLGPVEQVPLKKAREEADKARALLGAGVDPIDKRRLEKLARAEEAAPRTFREAAEEFLEARRGEWKAEKYERLWRSSFDHYVYPIIGALPVSALDTSQQGVAFIKRVLKPVWSEKPETARRVRQRVEQVLDFATAHGYRAAGDNPAALKRVQHIMGASPRRVVHRPSMPFEEVGAFMADLRNLDGLGARALELTILCATRTAETLGAEWRELDLDAAQPVWVIPGARMKGRKGQEREHRIPLSRQAADLLRTLRKADRRRGFVFPGFGTDGGLSTMAMLKVLERMRRDEVTVHGFRSTFRTWAGERTNAPREIAEAALAHVQGDKVERSYARGDLFQKRADLMQQWADFCDRSEPAAEVVPIAMGRKAGGG